MKTLMQKLCTIYKLGHLVENPIELTGGLLHKMYAIQTDHAKYAVKILNPVIMKRPPAYGHIVSSEIFAEKAIKQGVNGVSALFFDGKYVLDLDGKQMMIYPFHTGEVLKTDWITIKHCEAVGQLLAKLHQLTTADHSSDQVEMHDIYDSSFIGEEPWQICLNTHEVKLKEIIVKTNEALNLLSKNQLKSHRDLDPKNILWLKETPYIIDWESSGWIHPSLDLLEVALYWSDEKRYNQEKFKTLIEAYYKHGGIRTNLTQGIYAIFSSKIGWLEYSIKRAMGVEATTQEAIDSGIEDVIGTTKAILDLETQLTEILSWI